MDQNPTTSHIQELEQELEQKMSALQIEQIEEETKKAAAAVSVPYADLKSFPIDANAVLILEEADARTGQMAVIAKNGQQITVAVKDPANNQTLYLIEGLKNRGYTVTIVMVSNLSLQLAWQKYSLKKEKIDQNTGIITISEEDLANIQERVKNLTDIKTHLSSLPITQVLDTIIAGALQIHASDIHFEPEEHSIRLRYRIDGVLRDVTNLGTDAYPNILSRVKIVSGLKINIHETPQDGRFTIRKKDEDLEVRVSVLPGGYGENIVMRILDPHSINHELEDLGIREYTLEKVRRLLQKTTGAILTTGPTGAGKTTTLYAFIKTVNNPEVKIITIEDPIEYHIEGISQTQVDEQAGYTFADGLRSIMRQDPDVILVGEIRDGDTAEIAMQAALTGHLVFSTLHTNNAAGTIPRLVDLGVRPVTIAPAIKAAMAQRLVRRLCEKCKQKAIIKAEDLALIQKYLTALPPTILANQPSATSEVSYPQGCQECGQTGYQGRIGLYELFEITDAMEKLILTSPPISSVNELAIKEGMITLLQDGLMRVLEGVTSFEEVMRVVGE